MSSEFAIRARGLAKAYPIYQRPEDRLKQLLFGRWKKYYTEYWALTDFTLDVRVRETIGIVGRNGSGKSTLLQMVCGTLQPTAGTIETHGRIAPLLELGSGFNMEFTGRENVFLSATVLGLSDAQIRARLADIEAFAGIGEFIDQPVKQYSSGMFARLAFAVAAHVDPDILVVDEILSVGDAAFNQKCMRFIRGYKERGTLFFVSHDTAAVRSLCDRAVWLDRGSLRAVGPAKEICDDYLAALHEELDDKNEFKIGGVRREQPPPRKTVKDARVEHLEQTGYRNAIEVFSFDPDARWFGQRGATIGKVTLHHAVEDRELRADETHGGTEVALRIEGSAQQALDRLIVGFYVKDRLGQYLFGDNTYLSYRERPVAVAPGRSFVAKFTFALPYLPTGDYAVCVAVATGTQAEHVQQHWIDEALLFHVDSSHVARGLIGLPMHDVSLQAG
jgi:lipopolysaccharide transport system ATP-binding protein